MRSMWAAVAFAVCASAQEPGREIFHSGAITVTMEQSPVQGDAMAKLQDATRSWEARLGGVRTQGTPTTKSGPGGTFSAITAQFRNDPRNIMHSFLASSASGEVCHVRTATGFGAMLQFNRALQTCSTALAQNAEAAAQRGPSEPPTSRQPSTQEQASSRGAAPGTAAQATASPALSTPGAFQANWNNVDGVYFRSTTGIGYGGMVIIDYIPVVLFKDGTYFEIGKLPLEDTDLAAERANRPRRWGSWTRAGDVFTLQSTNGKPRPMPLQEGNFFRTFTFEEGRPLQGEFSRTGGGGTSAVGGEMGILTQSKYSFAPDGRFTTGSSMSAVGSGAQSGVSMAGGASHRMPGVGSYSLSRNTLTLRYTDGHTERRFFAYGSHHNPAMVDPTLIFLGEDVYVSEH